MTTGTQLIEYDRLAEAAWRRFRCAADRRADPFRLVTFVSVDDLGRPEPLTLVLRGAGDRDSPSLWFHVDRRSSKVSNIRRRPSVALLFYDPTDHVQIRVRGSGHVHTDDALADEHWELVELTADHIASIMRTDDPDLPTPQPDPRMDVLSTETDPDRLRAWRANFAVIEVHVEELDWLQALGAHQRRALLRAAGGWKAEPLDP